MNNRTSILRVALAFILILFSFKTTAIFAEEIDSLPPNFTWYVAKNGIGEFPMPHGWYVKEELLGATNVIYITKEKINVSRRGDFTIGMRITHTNSWSFYGSNDASRFVKQLAGLFGEITINGDSLAALSMRTMKNYYIKEKPKIAQHEISASRDRLFVMSFEAPKDSWEENYAKYGETMFRYYLK